MNLFLFFLSFRGSLGFFFLRGLQRVSTCSIVLPMIELWVMVLRNLPFNMYSMIIE